MLLSMNNEVSSISPQIVKHIVVIPEVVLSEASKLTDSVISNRKGGQRKHCFVDKKDSIT